jgi:hypothetical protein
MEPLPFVAALLVLGVLVAVVSAAVLTWRDRPPTQDAPAFTVVEAPDEIRDYIVLNGDRIREL